MKPLKDSELTAMLADGTAMSTAAIKRMAPDGRGGGTATDRASQPGVDPEFNPGNA